MILVANDLYLKRLLQAEETKKTFRPKKKRKVLKDKTKKSKIEEKSTLTEAASKQQGCDGQEVIELIDSD